MMKHNTLNYSKALLLMLLFCLPMTWLYASPSSAETKGFYKKLPPATMTIVKTDETCPNNGTIAITLADVPATASVLYEYWNNATPSTVVSSTGTIVGLPAGTYTVTAQITDGGVTQTLTQQVTIAKIYQPIIANSTLKSTCPGTSTGEITVTTTQGVPVNYQIISAPAAFGTVPSALQPSNVFTNLPAGVYQVRVYDSCGLYNTITATIEDLKPVSGYYSYFTVSNTNCSMGNLGHYGRDFSFPMTIRTIIRSGLIGAGGAIISDQTGTWNQTSPGVVNYGDGTWRINQPVTFTNPLYTYPINTEVEITDACGRVTVWKLNKQHELLLKGSCLPNAYFSWDVATYSTTPTYDRNPHMAFPVTVSWVNASNPADTGSTTSTTPNGTVSGLTVGATYNVTITDNCGKTITKTVTVGGPPPNVGQTAFVQALPTCRDGGFMIYMGTTAGGTNIKIDNFTFIEAPNPAHVGTTLAGNPALWAFTGGIYGAGHYVIDVHMGCVTHRVTFDAPGYGTQATATLSPSTTCNTANVTINDTFVQDGVPIPNPTGAGGYTPIRYSLVPTGTIPVSANEQSSNVFLNVPNGVYDYYVSYYRTSSTECAYKKMGTVTVAGLGPQIQSPFGFQCLDGANAGGFGVLVQATGVGTLEYAITAIGGVPVATPAWQTSNEFTGLAAGTYTLTVRDNCATTSTIFDTSAITVPRVRSTKLCPGQTGSLYAPFVPSFDYQWFKDGVPVTNGGNISGADTYRLTFTPFTAADDNATYSVRISYADCINREYEIIINNTPPNSGADYSSPDICADSLTAPIDLRTYLSSDAQATGEWTQVSGTGGTLNDYIFNPAGIDATSGPFVFKYTTIGGCSEDEATITLNIIQCVCYEDPNTTGTATDSKVGITLLKRAGAENTDNWPMARKSAHLVLESNTKGFVVTRVATADLPNITAPQEGMMVYDTTAKCLKLYSDGVWSCFSTPTCP